MYKNTKLSYTTIDCIRISNYTCESLFSLGIFRAGTIYSSGAVGLTLTFCCDFALLYLNFCAVGFMYRNRFCVLH